MVLFFSFSETAGLPGIFTHSSLYSLYRIEKKRKKKHPAGRKAWMMRETGKTGKVIVIQITMGRQKSISKELETDI